jgi:hypothetical protein
MNCKCPVRLKNFRGIFRCRSLAFYLSLEYELRALLRVGFPLNADVLVQDRSQQMQLALLRQALQVMYSRATFFLLASVQSAAISKAPARTGGRDGKISASKGSLVGHFLSRSARHKLGKSAHLVMQLSDRRL